MFESIIAYVLNKFLSGYIDEVDYNNLKLGLFSGTFELNNIKVKPSALYQFDVPIEVKYGTIGKLKINISYTQFTSQPAVAIVEDVFVLLAPFEDNKYDSKRFDEVNRAHKQKLLSETEKIDTIQIFEPKQKGYADKITDTIINNIQIYIKNVHIRYEDKYSINNECISFGFYLKEFRAETIDAFGKSNFSTSDEKVIYKLGALKGFNFYWNVSSNPESLISNTKFDAKSNIWNVS
jgi:vacuolar protein sorting-associated protein 13A/C